MNDVSGSRIAYILIAFGLSVICGIYFGDELRISEKPSEYIGVTFSILAASLFAVVSIVGDPSMLLPGTWRVGWESAKGIQDDLHRFNMLFIVYLLILGLLIVTELIENAEWERFYFLFNIFAGVSTFGFLMSLGLPFALARIQRDRLKQEIDQRRKPK